MYPINTHILRQEASTSDVTLRNKSTMLEKNLAQGKLQGTIMASKIRFTSAEIWPDFRRVDRAVSKVSFTNTVAWKCYEKEGTNDSQRKGNSTDKTQRN